MSQNDRDAGAENRSITQLETAFIDLQQSVEEQLQLITDQILEQGAEVDGRIAQMAEERSRGANVPLVPFYGNRNEDFAQYVKQFELICDANNYAADKRAQILAWYLRDKAFYVYDSLTAAQKAAYQELKTALGEKFNTTDYKRFAHQKFQERKQHAGETVADYGCDVHRMGLAALSSIASDQRDTLIREKFIAGLLSQLRELIIYSSPKTFNKAMTLAERLEGLQAGKQDVSTKSVMLLESISDRLSKLECRPKNSNWSRGSNGTFLVEAEATRPNTAAVQSSNDNLANIRPEIRNGDIVCYRCNCNGHIARNCPRNRDMSSVVCRACNRMGHFARNCQSRRATFRPRPGPQNYNRRPHIPIGRYGFPPRNGPPNRTMAVSVSPRMDPPTEAPEEQRWQPLIGSIRFSRNNKVCPAKDQAKTSRDADKTPGRPQPIGGRYLDGKKALTWMKVHLLFMIFLILGTKVTAQRQNNIKSSLSMICQTTEGKALWRLPATFDCPAGNHTAESKVTPVKMLLFKRNYIQYKTKAWKCVRITEEIETFTYFFGDENLKKNRKHSDAVSAEDCISMKNFKTCNNQPMIYYGGIYQTNNKLNWYYPGGGINCCHWKKFSATNCYMYETKVYQRHESPIMESTAGDVSNCKYKKGQCVLNDGAFLLWDVSRKAMCNYLEWKAISGKRYGTSWLSDDSNLALTFTQEQQTKNCIGRTLIKSDQGIAVIPERGPRILRKPRQLAEVIMENIRENKGENKGGGVVSTAQLAASLEALELRWKQNMEFGFSHALNGVCNFMRSVVELLKTQVLANPTMAIRSLTNQSDIFAKSGGNIVEIFPCTQLSRAAFTFQAMNGSCTAQLPIQFKIKNETNFGFMDPLTNIIHRFSAPMDCRLMKEVPIQLDGSTYLYHAKTGAVTLADHIPTLKVMEWSVQPIVDMKATIFHEIVMYNWEELQTHINLNDIMGGLSRQRAVLEHMGITMDDDRPAESADNAVSRIMKKGYFGFLYGLAANFFQVWTFTVCLYVTVCVVVIHCVPLNAIPAGLKIGDALNLAKDKWRDWKQRRARDIENREPENIELDAATWSSETENFNQRIRMMAERMHQQPLLQLMPPPSATEAGPSAPARKGSVIPRKRARYDDPPEIITSHDSNVQPFTVSAISGTSEVVIYVCIEGMKVRSLVDTGSSLTLVPQHIARLLRTPVSHENITAVSMTGHKLGVVGETTATVRIGNKDVVGKVVVVKESPYELIIGTDLMKHFGTLKLDFEKKLITFGTENCLWSSHIQRLECSCAKKPESHQNQR